MEKLTREEMVKIARQVVEELFEFEAEFPDVYEAFVLSADRCKECHGRECEHCILGVTAIECVDDLQPERLYRNLEVFRDCWQKAPIKAVETAWEIMVHTRNWAVEWKEV